MSENPEGPDAQITDIATRLTKTVEQAAKETPPPKDLTIVEDQICRHCGCLHVINCPRVKSLTSHPSGEIAHVEFWPWREWCFGPTPEERKLIDAGEMEDHTPLAHIMWPDSELFYPNPEASETTE